MKRNKVIDVTKGLGILLVVLGHNWLSVHEKGLLFRLIFSFHMPLFFFVSGLIISSSGSFRSFVYSKVLSLLKPYFVVLFFVSGATLIKEFSYGHQISAGDFERFAKVIYGTGNIIPWSPMWFLPHLFLTSILSFVIIRMIGYRHALRVVIVSIAILIFGCYLIEAVQQGRIFGFGLGIPLEMGLPWSIDILPLTSAFVLLGYATRSIFLEFKLNGFLLSASFVLFVFLHTIFAYFIDFNFRIYGNLFVSSMEAISGIYLCFAVSSILIRSKIIGGILSYIGERSLFILIFHPVIQHSTFSMLRNFQNNYICAFVSFVAACAMPLMLFEIVKRNGAFSALLLPPRKATNIRPESESSLQIM